jgi:mono/diheme cytochrome c family protein
MSRRVFEGRGRSAFTARVSGFAAFVALACCAGVGGGCKATPPGRMETAIVTRAKHWVTVGNRSEKNPLSVTADGIAEGKASFSHYCVACHGLDGQNTGVPFAETMSPPIPSLASADVQSYSDGQLKSIIDNGLFPSGMPASKGILTDEEIWGTVLYIRHLPAAGSLGEPAMYSGDEGQESGSADGEEGKKPGGDSKNSKKSAQSQPR